MELLGYLYEKPEDKIPANGRPITRDLMSRGYVQKNNVEGEPLWYVKRAKVWIYVNVNGEMKKFDIYSNIMSIYPDRKKMTPKLAQDVIFQIMSGDVEFILQHGDPWLIRK